MKKIVCEMCGSNDLLKKDNVFVCQSCGTKYSVEEAKKMMVEGKVDVSGSKVKVDDTDKIKNYLMMANNAYDADNKKEAENYCNKIIEIEPTNCDAWLLKGKAAGWQSTLANLRIDESVNAFQKAIDSAPKDRVKEMKKEAIKETTTLCSALVSLACKNYAKYGSVSEANTILNGILTIKKIALKFLIKCKANMDDINAELADVINVSVVSAYNKIRADYVGRDGHPNDYDFENYTEKTKGAILLLETAISLCDDDKENDIQIYKNLIIITTDLEAAKSYTYSSQRGGWVTDKFWKVEYKEQLIDKIMEYHNKIKELDPNYEVPPRPAPSNSNAGGCYVATCVYGSYDCPQVWTLRRYRDYKLTKTWYGRLFIHTYYTISPTIVKLFGNTKWFKKLWKGKLDKLVKKLQNEGIESTPYQDRDW